MDTNTALALKALLDVGIDVETAVKALNAMGAAKPAEKSKEEKKKERAELIRARDIPLPLALRDAIMADFASPSIPKVKKDGSPYMAMKSIVAYNLARYHSRGAEMIASPATIETLSKLYGIKERLADK